MINVLKQLSSFILPVTVLILVPIWIEKDRSLELQWTTGIGIVIMGIGLMTVVSTVASFMMKGKGTLAPWSPPQKLVTTGLHGYVRNPMIMGVLTTLLGESMLFMSRNIFYWMVIFFVINNIYFLVYEEPDLEKRFGEEYREYRKQVPRWFPKFKSFRK